MQPASGSLWDPRIQLLDIQSGFKIAHIAWLAGDGPKHPFRPSCISPSPPTRRVKTQSAIFVLCNVRLLGCKERRSCMHLKLGCGGGAFNWITLSELSVVVFYHAAR